MQKVDSRKITLVVLFILILGAFALLISKFTFAFLGPDIDEEKNVQGEVTTMGDTLIFSKGNNLSLNASTDNFNSASGNLTATTNPSVKLIANTKSGSATAVYYSGILINENTYTYSKSDNTAELILTVRDETGSIITSTPGLTYVTVNGVSGFDITGKTGAFNIVSEKEISTTSTTTGTTQTWTYTITFINFGTEQDQSVNENAILDSEVMLKQKEITIHNLTDVCSNGDNFSMCLAKLYNEYNSASHTLYYHENTLMNGAGDNSFRYIGKNPNNYVCFGTNNEICDDEHLYRIIGVFDSIVIGEDNESTEEVESRVKLIKADFGTLLSLGAESNGTYDANTVKNLYKGKLISVPTYYWSGSSSNTSQNWTNSTLNTNILNGTYLTKLDEDGNDWTNKIAMTEWKIGSSAYVNMVKQGPRTVYLHEIKNPRTDGNVPNSKYNSKIGLMYLSDYGFAADKADWDLSLNNYWMASIFWLDLGIHEWTISRYSDYQYGAFTAGSRTASYDKVYNPLPIRPTFYLNSDVTFIGGSGTETDPYRIA